MLAGVRPDEAIQVQWQNVNLDAGTVRIDAAASKVRRRRIVQLMPSTVAWLRVAQANGGLLPSSEISRKRYTHHFRAVLGWLKWKQDVLRHTAGSYLLAHHQDAGKVARWMGNSPGILLRYYVDLVDRETAAKFWAILP